MGKTGGKVGSGSKGSGVQVEDWRGYLPEELSGVEQRAEELDRRKAEWHGLVVPGEGETFGWFVVRVCVPMVWVPGGLKLWSVLKGLELLVLICWLAPVVAYMFVCWKNRNSSGGWIFWGWCVIGFGVVLAVPGVLAVLGL